MNRDEINKALTMLEDRIERYEISSHSDGYLCLTVFWIGGFQKLFHSMDEVNQSVREHEMNKTLYSGKLNVTN